MQRLKQHHRITQVIGIRDILNVRIIRPIRLVFAYRVWFEELEIDKKDCDDEDFASESDPLVAAHERGLAIHMSK